jgi:hypothetical protein
LIFIILLFIFVSRFRKKDEPESAPEHESIHEPEVRRTQERKYDQPYIQPSLKSSFKTESLKTTTIPEAIIVSETHEHVDTPKPVTKMDIEPESTTADLGYNEIKIEFRCNVCDSVIDTDVESCPKCGEEFGSLI